MCDNRADLYADGVLTLHEAVDELQAFAVLSGLVEAIGQPAVQEMMAYADERADCFHDQANPQKSNRAIAEEIGADEKTVRKARADQSAPEEAERIGRDDKSYPATQTLKQPLTRGKDATREPYAPPRSTVDAFLYVVALDDIDRLKAWLADHPDDAPTLLKLLESKLC
jgi:hypothetical protein